MREVFMSEDDGNRACGEGGCGYECEEVCVWVLGGRGVGVISGGVMWEGVGVGAGYGGWRIGVEREGVRKRSIVGLG